MRSRERIERDLAAVEGRTVGLPSSSVYLRFAVELLLDVRELLDDGMRAERLNESDKEDDKDGSDMG
jgi:hypothetical protein